MEDGLIQGRYKPLFLRARGGFSDVEVAWDTRLQRRVAIKRIPVHNLPDSASIEEARIAALLSNPNIVSIYDVERTGQETLIIMENVDGPSLLELLARSTELLDLDTITAIVDGVVQALDYAHENQVLHLDIKPANILIDHSGHIKVSDFGLAELAGDAGYGSGEGGTIGYMPPEQLQQGPLDVRSDLWALAALTYQLLCGDNPFFALSPQASLAHIVNEPVVLPSSLRPELGSEVDAALIKALSVQASERQANVTGFWAELQPYLGKTRSGRRRLKALVAGWADANALLPQEGGILGAGLMPPSDFDGAGAGGQGAGAQGAGAQGAGAQGARAAGGQIATGAGDQHGPDFANKNSNFRGIDADGSADDEADDAADTATSERYRPKREKQHREKRLGTVWERTGPRVRAVIARLVCALGCGTTAWLGLSAVIFLGSPVNALATSLATNTGQPVMAQSEFTWVLSIVVSLVVALVGFIVPSVGGALAGLVLALGFYCTGNWLVGNLVLGGFIAWWLAVGRRSVADAAVLMLTPLFCALQLPFVLPLLAGYFQTERRALATTGFAFFLASLIALLSIGLPDGIAAALFGQDPQMASAQAYAQPALSSVFGLLGGSLGLAQMPGADELWLPLIEMVTSPVFWALAASWLAAVFVMSLCCTGQSRVKYMLGGSLATLILAAGAMSAPLLLGSGQPLLYTATTIASLVLALAICSLLVALGVLPQPFARKREG
ncbi:MAG: serine/threonine protein kinase [Coriobacteriales bacterium]|jgi:hypothetical protein|nr:serine/threonine protein kinase [Coriobacteriales bacterium]